MLHFQYSSRNKGLRDRHDSPALLGPHPHSIHPCSNPEKKLRTYLGTNFLGGLCRWTDQPRCFAVGGVLMKALSLTPCETTGYYALFLKFVLPTNHLHRCMKTNNAGCFEMKMTVKSTIINLKGTIKELLSWSESLILETWRCNVE